MREPNIQTSTVKDYLKTAGVSPIKLKADITQLANSLQENAYPNELIKYLLLYSINRVDWDWLKNERNKDNEPEETRQIQNKDKRE